MLSPEYIDHLPDRVVELYADLEIRILEDMARRISKTGALTETAQWQMWRLEQIGAEREFIRYHLQRLTGKTQGEINELLVEAGEEALYYDDQIYRAAGLSPKALRDSEALQKIIKAGSDKTMRLFENLTSTTADTASRQFENALDAAYMDITSGAFSYQDAVRSAVKSLSKAGIDAIIYPSGHTDKMDVAVRRAVLTGVNQTTARMQIARADEMECDLVETTAHMGARPEHMDWQGRIFSRSGKSRKYPDFVKSTGYGTGPGLCGWNCRHSFFPYFEGLSERAYSRAKLREYENKTVTYNGRTLPYYDATQQQRYLERQIRRWKREYLAMDAAGLDTSEASAKLAAWRAKQKDFLTQTGLGEDKFRSQVYGFGRSQAARARAQAERLKKHSRDGIIIMGSDGMQLKIDSLTPCLVEASTGKIIETSYKKAAKSELKSLKAKGWLFDWTHSSLKEDEIYKLVVKGESNPQGLIALKYEDRSKAVYVQIAESAPSNRGASKEYLGVGGHLFAIAAQQSMEKGYGGFVFFDAKNTDLVKHYSKALGAQLLGVPHPYRMILDENAARKLLKLYTFGKE